MTVKSGAETTPKEKKPTTTKPKADKVTETKTAATVVTPTTKAPEIQPEKPVTTATVVNTGNDTIAGGESLGGTVTGEAKAPEIQPEKPFITDSIGIDSIVGGGAETITVDPKEVVILGAGIRGMTPPLVHIDEANFGIHQDVEPVVNVVKEVTYPRMVVIKNPSGHTVTEPSSRVYAEPYRQSKPHLLNSEADYRAMQKGVDKHNARLKLETGITIIDFVGV